MTTTYVIAGTQQQARDFMRRAPRGRNAVDVRSVETLVGVRLEDPARVTLVGTWWCRADWPELQSELRRQLGPDALDRLERDL